MYIYIYIYILELCSLQCTHIYTRAILVWGQPSSWHCPPLLWSHGGIIFLIILILGSFIFKLYTLHMHSSHVSACRSDSLSKVDVTTQACSYTHTMHSSAQFSLACEPQHQHVGDRDAPIVSLRMHTPHGASRTSAVISSKQGGHRLVGRRHGRHSGAGLYRRPDHHPRP
jgi:hypothetical protein